MAGNAGVCGFRFPVGRVDALPALGNRRGHQMQVVLILPVKKIETREHKGKTYYDAVSEQELFDAEGNSVSKSFHRVGLDEEGLPEVTRAVQEAQGQPIALSVHVSARQGQAGRFPWVSYYGGRLWSGAL